MIVRALPVLLFLINFLSACSSSPPIHFYTLNAEAVSGSASPATAERELRIVVGPISIPDVVDRPQLVMRSGLNEVTLVEEHRWAEPLKNDIGKVMAENLGRLLGTGQVWVYPQIAGNTIDYRVLIAIQRFESMAGQAAAIDALWTIQRPSQATVDWKTGRSSVQQSLAGQGYEAVAAAHSRALAAISREIADTIRSDRNISR